MVKYPRLAVSQEQLTQDIQEGDYLLLLPCAQTIESLWIQVVAILNRGYYEGIVFNKNSLFGQVIRCHQRHIQQCIRELENE